MRKTNRASVLSLSGILVLVMVTSLFLGVPSVHGCTFAALKSVTLYTDPPLPVAGQPYTLTAALLFGGGMGHGNMLTAAENALSVSLTLAENTRVVEGVNPLQTTTPFFQLGYETVVPLTWTLVTDQPGQQDIQISVANVTFGQGQESSASQGENGLLAWEVVRPDMIDPRVEAGNKDGIKASSLNLMPSLHWKTWQAMTWGDILYTDANGTRFSVKAGELNLDADAVSPVIVTDSNGNRYLATNGRINVIEGPQVFAPLVNPIQPGPDDPVMVQARIIGEGMGGDGSGKATLFYSIDGVLWLKVDMAQIPGSELWQAEIPAQVNDGLTINYYLGVTDSAGKVVRLPRYSIRVVDSDRVEKGVRTTSLLTLAAIGVTICIVVLWERWSRIKKGKRARAKTPLILSDQQQQMLQTQSLTRVLARVRQPVSTEDKSWQVGFYVLLILAVIFIIVGIFTDQFNIVNLIIKMG
jgi:hypothetical protein